MTHSYNSISHSQERQLLQRVLMDGGPSGATPLYLRQLKDDLNDGFSTDTYINLFHKKQWSHLTGLKDFALELSALNSGTVHLYSLTNSQGPRLCLSLHVETHSNQINLHLNYEGDFFFFHWLPDKAGGQMPAAGYTAESRQPSQAVKIAMGVTTFERNGDLRLLVQKYRQARQSLPALARLSHMFVINNQINDSSKLSDLAGNGVSLINNPYNTGGAGGFGLAARMAVEAGDEAFTHVLFMDDDITIDPEAWLRTLNLLNNLKPEYFGQVICGGMFQRENPVHCHTLFEAIDQQAKHHNVSGSHDLIDINVIRGALERMDIDWGYPELTELPRSGPGLRPYAAWWYCVLPLNIFHEYGFPLPIFFRGDDIEMGLRISKKVLWLNGICVWHPSFEGKSSHLRTYLGFRNNIIFCFLHFSSGYWIVLKKYIRRLARSLAANDYERAAITIKSLEDSLSILRHPWDGPETISEINRLMASHQNMIAPPTSRNAPSASKNNSAKVTSLPYLCLVLLSLGGALIPGFLFRRESLSKSYAYVRGCFPSRYVNCGETGSTTLAFKRSEAFRVSLKGLKQLLGFIFFGRAAISKLKQDAFSAAGRKRTAA